MDYRELVERGHNWRNNNFRQETNVPRNIISEMSTAIVTLLAERDAAVAKLDRIAEFTETELMTNGEARKIEVYEMDNRYPWWGYVRYIVRQYPEREKIQQNRELTRAEAKGCSAVQSAIDYTERMECGGLRLKVIKMIHWDRTHTLEGAALSIPCGRRTAAYWQREFFEEVARGMGFLG